MCILVAPGEALCAFGNSCKMSTSNTAMPQQFNENNKGAIKLANKPMTTNVTKHIDIKRRYYIRELVDAKDNRKLCPWARQTFWQTDIRRCYWSRSTP
jgi:hypothetical protein